MVRLYQAAENLLDGSLACHSVVLKPRGVNCDAQPVEPLDVVAVDV
jgi:hypothetical protein